MVTRSTVKTLARRFLPSSELTRLEAVPIMDAGHGYDTFGANGDWVQFGAAVTRPLYERWFRVTSHDAHHIPEAGGAVLAANHSGTLPFDGIMIWADVLKNTHPPRVVRAVMDHFVPLLPLVGTFFTRNGAVGGSRANVRALLEADELLLIFPEGTVGIGKPYSERYQLQSWRVGHAEMALRHRVPVIPVAVIGAEEQMPQIGRLRGLASLFGVPYIPVPATPIPLPVHYHIYYGPPVHLADHFDPDQADNPDVLLAAAAEVKAAVDRLIVQGLGERRGVFS